LKRKKLIIPVIFGIIFSLLFIVGAATTDTTNAATAAKDKSYNYLDPRGIQPPVQLSSLAKRLDTFDGKTMYVNQGEADPIIMPALWERVQKDYPKANWKYIQTSSFGPSAPETEILQSANAVIRGIAW
jgi:hypothetical protein